jgi:hypothetical protein
MCSNLTLSPTMEPLDGSTEGVQLETNTPKLLASTSTAFSCSIAKFRNQEPDHLRSQAEPEPRTDAIDEAETNYFKSVQW